MVGAAVRSCCSARVFALLWALGAASVSAQEEPVASSYVGEQVCRACHVVESEHWGDTVHARAFRGQPRTDLEAKSCEACHGPGSAHVTDPQDPSAITGFTSRAGATPAEMNDRCLECHRAGPLLHWRGSVHEWQDLACSDCHNPMTKTSARGLLREDRVSRTCFSCHPHQRTEFRKRSHMPLLEGKISCVDCHAPHGSSTDPLLKGDSVNQVCYACHPDKRGPFLFEHAPVRDNCSLCHSPHGSNHLNLLVAQPPFLCQQCHGQIDDVPFPGLSHPSALLTRSDLGSDERLMNRSCTNCHAQIHGSNHPSGARFNR